jgi:N-acetylmuramoyl-L-alanine amidase/PKD repeat protein
MKTRKRTFIGFALILTFLISYRATGQALEGVRICIDAGHGGHSADDRQISLPNGIIYWESEGDLETAFHLKDYLESFGADIKLTRTDNTDDSDIALSERSAIANAFNADFFHSIHTNGGGGTYSLVLYKEVNGAPSFYQAFEMAEIMAPYLQDLMKTNAHLIRGDMSFLGFNLGVLKFATMPSTLSESSFHDLPDEGLRLKNAKYLQNYAWAMAKSFLEYFSAPGFQTGRVGGVVRDLTYGTVINGIRVECQPGDNQYTGDQYYNGFYAVDGLEPGNYQLIFSKPGYLNDTTTIEIMANQYLDLDQTIQYFNNGFPNVDFFVDGLPAGVGDSLIFDASSSTDDGTIVKFEWDFGDGSILETGETAIHSFNQDGAFNVTLSATDNDGNLSSTSKVVEIVTNAPKTPELISVVPLEASSFRTRWQKGSENNLLNYNIYISENRTFSDTVQQIKVSADLPQVFDIVAGETNKPYYLRLTSENVANLESDHGDTYVIHLPEDTASQAILIIDGFNRNGSYTGANHDFVATYSEALAKSGDFRIASCSNVAIITDKVSLQDYDIVFWFLGDESTADETFSRAEQDRVSAYLEKSGKLFVSGSEIGWDLVAKGSDEDKVFYQDYLKAAYISDGGAGRSPAEGLPGSGFDSTSLHFGQVYPEDYPDELDRYGGSETILKYATNTFAGVKYRGPFGNSDKEGGLVYIGFPLESVASPVEIAVFVEKVINFFGSIPSNVKKVQTSRLFDIYPTIIHDRIDVYHDLSSEELVEVLIQDISAKQFYQQKLYLNSGKSQSTIYINETIPGMYFVTFKTGKFKETHKVLIR